MPETVDVAEDHGEHDQARRRRRCCSRPRSATSIRTCSKMAEKYPEGALRALRRPVDASKHPKNAGSYFGYIDEVPVPQRHRRRLRDQDQQARLHRRQADPAGAAQHQRLHARRAARSIPKITTQVIFTGDWSMPVKEAEATNSLIDQGVDVITCTSTARRSIVETAERARRLWSAATTPTRRRSRPRAISPAPSGTGTTVYPKFVKMSMKGEPIPNFLRGGLKEGFVKMSPYGPAVSEAARKHADDVKAKMIEGRLRHLQGPAQGQHRQGRDPRRHRADVQTDPELER